MYVLILTIWLGNSSSSVAVPFQTLALCETAAATHKANIAPGTLKAVLASCVKTSEK